MATRRERVILDLEDNLTGGLAKAAVASRLLKGELNDLGRDSTSAGTGLDRTGTSARKASPEIDRLSGRLKVFRDVALVLGPVLSPLGAATIPVLTGAVAGLGAAAAGLGVSILALQGVGDALGALDDYQLEKTPENLAKLAAEMEKMGPSGAHFVRFLDSLEPELKSLQMAARDGLLPGVEDGITSLLTDLPQIRDLVSQIAGAMGGLAADAGADLAGPEWVAFFEYLRTDAAPTLEQFSRTIGNFAQGFANLLVGLAPATRDFGAGLEGLSQKFANWTAGLDDNQSFQEFVDYVRQSGPQAVELLGALARAIAGIAQAMAPYGSVVLPVLTQVADLLAVVASTDAGAALIAASAGLVAFNRAAALSVGTMTKLSTALAANPWGLAAAALTHAVVQVVTADDQLVAATQRAQDALDSGNTEQMRSELESLRDALDETAIKMYPDAPETFFETFKEGIPVLGTFNKGIEQAGALWTKFSGSTEDAEKKVKELEDAIAGGGTVLTGYRNAIVRSAGASLQAAAALEEETAALEASTEAMRDKRQEAIEAFDAETRYAQAVRDATKQSKRNKEGLDENTKAGRNNRDALSNLASAWNDQEDAVNNNVYAFREARRNFIETAVAMGVPRQAARDLARELLEIPKNTEPKVTVPTGPAMAGIRAIEEGLNRIADEDIFVNIKRRYSAAAAQGVGPAAINETPRTSRPRTSTSSSNVIPIGVHGRGATGEAKADLFAQAMRGATVEVVDWADAVHGASGGLKSLKRQLNEAEIAVQRETRQRDALVSRRNEVRSSIASDLSGDLFGTNGDVWSANAGMNPQVAAEARRDRAKRWVAALRTLKGMHVPPTALQAIIAEGLEATEFMASQGAAYVSTFSATLAEAASYTTQAQNIGANAVVSVAEMNAANAELREANKRLHAIEKAIKAADKGNRDGHKGTRDSNGQAWASVRRGHRRGKASA